MNLYVYLTEKADDRAASSLTAAVQYQMRDLDVPYPCVMTAELQDNRVLLCFYTARTPLSPLNARRGFRQWQKKLPASVVLAEEAVSMQPQTVPPAAEASKGKKDPSGKER